MAETLISRAGRRFFKLEDIGADICPIISSFFCIYCSKNEECCLDLASLECFRHKREETALPLCERGLVGFKELLLVYKLRGVFVAEGTVLARSAMVSLLA